MLTRRQVLQRPGVLGAGTAVALVPAGAQGERRPGYTIALPSNPETINPHQFRSVLTGSILVNVCEMLAIRGPKTMELAAQVQKGCRRRGAGPTSGSSTRSSA
jgi:hypothetical protein